MLITKMAESQGLSELFTRGWDVQKRVENGSISASDKCFKEEVQEGIGRLETATRLASELDMFSRNEQLEEIATNDLKYLLIPALLGDLVSQLTDGDRLDILRRAKVYLADYLQRCADYGLTEQCSPPITQPDSSDQSSRSGGKTSFMKVTATRESKIARYKAKKETEKKLKQLSDQLAASSTSPEDVPGRVDEEVLRAHTKTLLELWVMKTRELMESIDQETELLQKMMEMGGGELPSAAAAGPPPPPVNKPSKPLVITHEMLREKLLGAGYPSLPTVSLEEFYQQEYSRQVAQAKAQQSQPKKVNPEEEEDKRSDDDDEAALMKARAFDEYKDEHRRGDGNRKGKG